MKFKTTTIIILTLLLGAVTASAAGHFLRSERPVKDEYIVVFNDDVRQSEVERTADKLARAYGGRVQLYYKYALRGFSVEMKEAAAIRLSRHAKVRVVEENGIDEPSGLLTQTRTPAWGIDRIDQANLPLNNMFIREGDGTGVHVFIIDTGINTSHYDFLDANGVSRIDIGNSVNYAQDGSGIEDCNGHGTAVASIAAGRIYGVAKNATIHVVRVGSCSGFGSRNWKVAGLDYVASRTDLRPAVANYSWNNDANDSFYAPIAVSAANLVASGVTLVNSAGNANAPASNYTPTFLSQVIAVGATDDTDARAFWGTSNASNYGPALDLFAPGKDIMAAGIGSPKASLPRTGTSFAAPHVTGAAAIYLEVNSMATPAMVQQHIVNKATPNKVTNQGTGSTRKLLYVGPGFLAP